MANKSHPAPGARCAFPAPLRCPSEHSVGPFGMVGPYRPAAPLGGCGAALRGPKPRLHATGKQTRVGVHMYTEPARGAVFPSLHTNQAGTVNMANNARISSQGWYITQFHLAGHHQHAPEVGRLDKTTGDGVTEPNPQKYACKSDPTIHPSMNQPGV